MFKYNPGALFTDAMPELLYSLFPLLKICWYVGVEGVEGVEVVEGVEGVEVVEVFLILVIYNHTDQVNSIPLFLLFER